MTTSHTTPSISRRAALAGLGAGGIGLALAGPPGLPPLRTRGLAMATHPIIGVWNVKAPPGPSLAVFLADGTNIQAVAATQAGPDGVVFVSTQVGSGEPVSERGVHFTGVQLHSDADGNLVGTVEIDAYPVVSEDGQSLLDDDPRSGPLVRDAAGNLSPTCGAPAARRRPGSDGRGGERPADSHASCRHPDFVTGGRDRPIADDGPRCGRSDRER